MEAAFIILSLLLGLVLGIFVGKKAFQPRVLGQIRVDHSDVTDAPYLFLELGSDIPDLLKYDKVTFTVRAEDFIPHK